LTSNEKKRIVKSAKTIKEGRRGRKEREKCICKGKLGRKENKKRKKTRKEVGRRSWRGKREK
jgi:hypothetical protein